jgi:hypothetical protein
MTTSIARRHRLALVAVTMVGILATFWVQAPPAEGRRNRTFVTHDCQSVKRRPWRIIFTCADGNFFVDHLAWRFWGKRRARAHGTYHYNDCNPSCAGGTFHEVEGKLRLKRRRFCENVDKFVFKRAIIHYSRPVNGDERETRRLFCPL